MKIKLATIGAAALLATSSFAWQVDDNDCAKFLQNNQCKGNYRIHVTGRDPDVTVQAYDRGGMPIGTPQNLNKNDADGALIPVPKGGCLEICDPADAGALDPEGTLVKELVQGGEI